MRTLLGPLTLLAALCAAGPASASITVAKTAADTITVTSTADAPADAITYKLTAGKLGIDRTTGENLAPGLGCTGNATNVTCAVDFITKLVIQLGPGDDQITGAPTLPVGMHAEIFGGPGRDTLRGSDSADDLLSGDEGDDVLDGGYGDDTLLGGAGDDTLTANLGADVYRGGTGFDALTYASYSTGVRVTVGGSGGSVGEGDDVGGDLERVDGGTGDDTLVGSGAGEYLSGGAGNDAIDGAGGADVLSGGPGDDALTARDGVADVVSCGDGTDSATTDQLDGPDSCEAVSAATVATGGGASGGAPPSAPAPAIDADADGSPLGADCDDHDRAVHPGAREIAGNAKDDDCNGVATSLRSPAIALTIAQTAGAKATLFRRLSLAGAPAGATVSLTCKAAKKRACPFAKTTAKAPASGKAVSFLKALKKARLPVGTVLELRVEAGASAVVHVERLTTRARKAPTCATSCLNPATKTALAC